MDELAIDEIEIAENHGFRLDARQADREPVLGFGQGGLSLE